MKDVIKKDIYAIYVNDKVVYIGSTTNIKRRIQQHKYNNESNISKLIKTNNYYYKILEQTVIDYNDRENYWILFYKSNNECNIIFSKEVEVYNKQNILVYEFISMSSCSRIMNLDIRRIYSCLKNKRKSYKGYFFKYKNRNKSL